MRFSARVEISPKPSLFDPEGEATKKSLSSLKFPVSNVRSSKVFVIIVEAASRSEAESFVEGMCRKLLANPNKDDYKITISEENG